MTSSELREAIRQNVHLQGCQAYCKGWNEHVSGKDFDDAWIDEYEEGIIDDLLDTVIAALPPARTGKSIEADYKARLVELFTQAKSQSGGKE